MIRWFQDKINKKSDRPSRADEIQSVEVATDAAICDGANISEEEPVHRGGNAPSDLSRSPCLEQRQDPLAGGSVMFHSKTQEPEVMLTTCDVGESPEGSDECPAKCPSPNSSVDVKSLSCNSRSSVSSMTGAGQVDAHLHCCLGNSSNPSSTHKSTEDSLYAQNVMGSSLSLQKHREGCYASESTSATHEYIESVSSSQQHQGSVSSPPKQTESTCESNVDNSKSWLSESLVSATRKTSMGSLQGHPYSPENNCNHQEFRILEESARNYNEQENKTFNDTGSDSISEANVTQKSAKDVSEVNILDLQETVTSENTRENGHNNEELLTPAARSESVTPEGAAGASDQVTNPVPDVQLECDKGSAKKDENTKVAVVQNNKASQTQNIKYKCPNLYCYPQACLYNQKGKKCTVLGEHFILTYLKESPVLVSTAIQNTELGPLGCMIVWCSGKLTELRHLPDGTELYFDAVVSPVVPTFVTLVIWQGTKPTQCVQPFYNCYIIIELIRNCPVKFVSFSKENGVVSTLNKGNIINVVFSKSVFYIDGKGTEKVSEIKDLSKSSSKQLYADVLRLMTVDKANEVAYGFMCSCIWLGCKPNMLNIPLYDPFKLYRKTPGCFPVASKQALILCDADAILEVEGATCKITFENDGLTIVLSCDQKILFSGNERVHPISGKVKVHLRRGVSKNTYTWQVFMVQVPPSLPIETTPNSTLPDHTNEATGPASHPEANPPEETSNLPHTISTKSSCKSAVLPEVTDLHVTSSPPESDVILRPQYTSTSVKPKHDKLAVTSNNVVNEEHIKSLPESPCISEMSGGSTVEKESQAATNKEEERVELIVKGNQSSHSEGESLQDNQHTPLKVVKNSNGVLKYISEGFVLETDLQGKKVHIEMGKTPWIALENGIGERCQTSMLDLLVGFDAQLVDIPGVGLVGHILALWSGKKPLKASYGSSTYYFDAPGIYHGSDEKGCFNFMVLLEGKVSSITTTSTTTIFEESGEQCASLMPRSHVLLHLSLRQDTWTSFLVVLKAKHKTSNLTKEGHSLSSMSLTKPESDTVSSPLNLQPEVKTDNGNPTSATHKTSREYEFAHYLRNLHGTLTETNGKRVVITNHKDIPLSILIPEDCLVDVNAVALDVKTIPLGTEIHVDAFCENIDSTLSYTSYWAAIAWKKKRAQRTVALTGNIFHFRVAGKCLNSNEKEVGFEFTVQNKKKPCHVVCRNAYIIMPDGTYQALECLRAGTPVYANLVQLQQDFIVNKFIYVDAAVTQPPPTSMTVKENPASNAVTGKITKTKHEERLPEPPKHEDKLPEPPPTLIDNVKESEVESTPQTVNEKEVTPVNEYSIAKGTFTRVKKGVYSFTDDKKKWKMYINPNKIAIDSNVDPDSPSGEFYLVYHKKTWTGKCGWYRHESHQVYLQHGMIVHTHNMDTKIITLALPDNSSLYHFLFDSDTTVTGSTGNSVSRFEQLKSGRKVHPIFEDIEPVLIDDCVVSHRIVLMTTVKGLSVICLNFLKHSLFHSEENEISNNESEVSVSQPKDDNEPCGDNTGTCHNEEQAPSPSLSDATTSDVLFRQQEQVKQKLEPEENINESQGFLSASETHTCSEIDSMNELLDKHYEDYLPILDDDGRTLRDLVATKNQMVVHRTHITRYVTLCGEIQPGNSGTYVFCNSKLLSPIQITSNLPHCNINMCESKGKTFMLARKMCARVSGFTIDHEPLVVWPQERKCDPYVVVTYKVSRRKNLLLITDAADDDKEKCYLFDYNLVFSLKKNYKLHEVINLYSKQDRTLVLYAVVDRIKPFQIEDHYVEGKILLLTTSKKVAAVSIDVFIGSCYEEDLYFQMPLSPVLQTLHQHKARMARASSCKRGSTYYFTARDCNFDSNFKLVGGCLESCMDDFAIIRCDRKSYTAACHLSNVYYQGEIITSWDTISKPHWTNFWAIILPLDDAVEEDKWEVNAVALVAWSCRGPKVLALHQCYYHVPTAYVPYFGTVESLETTSTNLLQSQENSHSSESFAGKGMSLSELESWQCQAGDTIVSFEDNILQSCGLKKMTGKVTLVNGEVVLFTSNENEVVMCKLSDIFIKGERCKSVKKIFVERDQTFTLVAQKCIPAIYLEKYIQMKVIIAFTTSLKEIGIHVCNKHACILESSLHKEEMARAQEVFQEIAVLSKQSTQWSDYYLSKIATSEIEAPTPPPDTERVVKHTLCYGLVISIDKESPDQVRVNLQHGSESLTLPVSRSRLMGLHRDLSLHHAVGHPLKVILYSLIGNEREENRIVMGWGSFSKDPSSVSLYSNPKPEWSCSQKSKFHCCPRGVEVRQFQDLYNSDMYEVRNLYKLRKIDVESGKGFFHYWLDEKLVTCKIEFIVGWLKIDQVQEELWNLLMAKGPETGREYPEAVAAWQGDCDSLVVVVCDVHGTHGLTVSQEHKTKTEKKSVPSPHRKVRRNSEPPQSVPAASVHLMPPTRYRRNSEPMETGVITGVNLRQYSIMQEDDAVLSTSLPNRTDTPSGCGLEIKSKEHPKNLPSYCGSIALLSIEEDSVAEEGKVYPPSEDEKQPHQDQPLCTSSVCDESVMFNLESEKDDIKSIVKPKLTCITSDSFLWLDNHCGLMIDSLSHTVALVRQGRLYINNTKPKESLKQLSSTSCLGIITAVVVPLASPDTLADLKVTHEAVVAWIGTRPPGLSSMVKNISIMPGRPGSMLQDKTKGDEKLECDPDVPYNMTDELTKIDRCTLLNKTVTLKILLRKLECVFGCFVEDEEDDNCDIFISSTGPVLFDRKLLSVRLEAEAASGIPQSEVQKTDNLKAMVLELEQPIMVLGFEVKKIGVMVWSEEKPVIDADFVARSLDVYKMKWNVEFINTFDQLELEDSSQVLHQNKVPSLSYSVSEDIQEVAAFCYPTFKEELCTILSIEDNYVVFYLNEEQGLALGEDIWCQKEILQVGMELEVVCVEFTRPLTFCAHNFIYFAVLLYVCDQEPEEATTIKSNWMKGTAEKFAHIKGKVDSKKIAINLQVKINSSPSTQPMLTDLELLPPSIQSIKCKLIKVMDEWVILKVKNKKKIKVFFQKDAVLINNETFSPQKWNEILQMLKEQKKVVQCTGEKLTPQERENVKEKTGEEVQYKADLVWCTTGISALGVEAGTPIVFGTTQVPKFLNADLGCHVTQLTGDTDNSTNTSITLGESLQSSTKSLECLNVQSVDPSSTAFCWSECVLQNKAKKKKKLKYPKITPLRAPLDPPHPGSLWAARPTLRVVLSKQDTISECIVGTYTDDCGILISASGPILFYKNIIDVTQQEEMAFGTFQTEQNVKALVVKLEHPVEILGYEVRKIAMQVWRGEKSKGDVDISISLDIYKLNWIVVLICNESAVTKRFKVKPIVCHSFVPAIFVNCDTSSFPEIIYHCSQDYSVRQLRYKFDLAQFAIFDHQDNHVMALMDDVKFTGNCLRAGMYLWVISVRLSQPFRYFCLPISHIGLLVYSEEIPEAATIKYDWSRGEIEKVFQAKIKVDAELENVNIRIKVDKPAKMKPYVMDPVWPTYRDRPEADMIFAVECEVFKLIKNCGVLKAEGRLLKGKELLIYFRKSVVLLNSKGLPKIVTLADQLSRLQNQIWRCTAVRLKQYELESMRTKMGEEILYKANIVWGEMCPSVQNVQIPENGDVTKAITSTALTPATTKQSEGAEVMRGSGQVEGIESLYAVDTPINTGTKPKRKRNKKAKGTKDKWEEEQQSSRVGRLTEIHRTVAQLVLEDGQLKYVARDQCFLYGLCLGQVELWHVLSIELTMNYELTEDGKELKKVWLGEPNSSDPAVFQNTLRDWCLINNVSSSATTALLLQAGWLPSELTPTVPVGDNVDVVDVAASRVIF